MTLNDQLAKVSDLFHARFVHKGRTPEALDCVGLIKICLKRFLNFELPEFDYEELWFDKDPLLLSRIWPTVFTPILCNTTLQLGDILFFRFHKEAVNHCAFYIGDGKMIQCLKGAGVLVTPVEKFKRFRAYVGRIPHG